MSKPRFTVTLGRSGQVVKRGGRESEYAYSHSDTKAVTGSKRFRVERVASGANAVSSSTSKRQRGYGVNWSCGNGVHDPQISRHDLQLKLMRTSLKRIQRTIGEHGKMDRRQKLSKTNQPSAGHDMPHQRSEPTGSSRSLQMHAMERSRFKASRGFSPMRNFGELRQVPSLTVADASKAGWFLSNNGTSRPISSTPLTMKGPQNSKPVTLLAPLTSFGQKSSPVVEEPLTVAGLLQSLGLGKYNIHFRAEEVDMTALRQMGDTDLKDMGIPMGERKKIILSLLPNLDNHHNCNVNASFGYTENMR